jgi:hypothetical protein
VDIHFESARLSEATFARFQDKSEPPPVGVQPIDFLTEDVTRQLNQKKAKPNRSKSSESKKGSRASVVETDRDANETCLIFVKAEVPANAKLPTKVYLDQRNGSSTTRDFYLTVDTDLFVSMKTSPPISKEGSSNSWAPGCGKLLKVGTWEWHHSGFWEINLIASANSPIHFSLVPSKPDTLWKGPKDFFQPFAFGSKPFEAQIISIESLNTKRPPTLRAIAKDTSLKINNLMVNTEEIQVDFSGTALVQTNGEYVTSSLFEPVKKYPLYDAALTALIMAVLSWFLIRIKRIFSRRNNV